MTRNPETTCAALNMTDTADARLHSARYDVRFAYPYAPATLGHVREAVRNLGEFGCEWENVNNGSGISEFVFERKRL